MRHVLQRGFPDGLRIAVAARDGKHGPARVAHPDQAGLGQHRLDGREHYERGLLEVVRQGAEVAGVDPLGGCLDIVWRKQDPPVIVRGAADDDGLQHFQREPRGGRRSRKRHGCRGAGRAIRRQAQQHALLADLDRASGHVAGMPGEP
jgi:hypothetical protein